MNKFIIGAGRNPDFMANLLVSKCELHGFINASEARESLKKAAQSNLNIKVVIAPRGATFSFVKEEENCTCSQIAQHFGMNIPESKSYEAIGPMIVALT